MFSGGDKAKRPARHQEDAEKLREREELLLSRRDFLKAKVHQELLCAKKNSRDKRRVALQALRRKKGYERHIKYIDCAVKAMRSAHEHIEIMNKVNDLMKELEDQEATQDMSHPLCSSVNLEVEFDEDELLAELERLEKDLDESLFEMDRPEDTVPCSKVSSNASPSHPAKTEEDEVEDDLEYLRRWVNEAL